VYSFQHIDVKISLKGILMNNMQKVYQSILNSGSSNIVLNRIQRIEVYFDEDNQCAE